MPALSARFGFAPCSSSVAARSKCALRMASSSGVTPSGSRTLTSAPERDERHRGVGRAFARGVHQRRPLPLGHEAGDVVARVLRLLRRIGDGGRARVDLGPVLHQRPDRIGVVVGRRPHERRLAHPRFLGVDVGARRRPAPRSPRAGRSAPRASARSAPSVDGRCSGRRRRRAGAATIAASPLVAASDSGVTP